MNTSAASKNPTDWRVNCAMMLFPVDMVYKDAKEGNTTKKIQAEVAL